jgi:hypothetical protein
MLSFFCRIYLFNTGTKRDGTGCQNGELEQIEVMIIISHSPITVVKYNYGATLFY